MDEPRMRRGPDNYSSAAAGEELVPTQPIFMKSKGKMRKPHAIKQPLENRGHGAPPVGIQNDEMITPLNIFLEFFEIRLELLNDFIALVKDRIEVKIADIDASYLVPCLASG